MLNRIRGLGRRIGGLVSRRRLDEEFQLELDAHLEMLTEENLRRGLSHREARRKARVQLGGMTQLRETHREMWGLPWIETLLQDLRYGLRQLRRNPGFYGGCRAHPRPRHWGQCHYFSVVNAVLLEPLSYPEPQELVAIHQLAPGAAGLANFSEGLPLSPSMYFTYAEHNRTFQWLGVWTAGTASVTGVGQPEQVRAVYVSDGVLESLDVPP